MNKLEEQALVDALRRRGDHRTRSATLSCSVEEYRAGVRKVGRDHGWRIRTLLINDGTEIIVAWIDRELTDLERRAAMVTISAGRHYDEVLEELRRQNLTPVKDAQSRAPVTRIRGAAASQRQRPTQSIGDRRGHLAPTR